MGEGRSRPENPSCRPFDPVRARTERRVSKSNEAWLVARPSCESHGSPAEFAAIRLASTRIRGWLPGRDVASTRRGNLDAMLQCGMSRMAQSPP